MPDFDFHLDPRTGVPAYVQLVQQARRGLRLGLLHQGDQLPTVKEVVERLLLSPNTVLKAYRELELAGLIHSRPGAGTFVTRTLGPGPTTAQADLRRRLQQWFGDARRAGLDEETIDDLIDVTRRQAQGEEGVA